MGRNYVFEGFWIIMVGMVVCKKDDIGFWITAVIGRSRIRININDCILNGETYGPVACRDDGKQSQ
jgi:hypothetical protein